MCETKPLLLMSYGVFSHDVTAAILVYNRSNREKVSWEFGSTITQNMFYILLLFCLPTWPSHHVSENTLQPLNRRNMNAVFSFLLYPYENLAYFIAIFILFSGLFAYYLK